MISIQRGLISLVEFMISIRPDVVYKLVFLCEIIQF